MGIALEASPLDWLDQHTDIEFFDDHVDAYPYEFPDRSEMLGSGASPPGVWP